jgi:hypothetical protein
VCCSHESESEHNHPASEAERVINQILSAWKGSFVADACIAATQIGLLNSGNMIGFDHAKTVLKFHFDARKIDDIHWSTVYQAFQNGRSTVISNIELRAIPSRSCERQQPIPELGSKMSVKQSPRTN